MAINLTPEQTEILKSQGITKEQMQGDIDKFRNQGQTDEQIQESLNGRLQELEPQDISEDEGTPTYALKAETNVLKDVAKAGLAGVSAIPRAAGNFSNKYLRPIFGKAPLDEAQMQEVLKMGGANDYEPSTGSGNLTKILGELAPYLITGEAGLKAAVGMGGVAGTANSLNNDENPIIGGIEGVIAGLLTHGAIKGGQKAFETIQPKIAETMAHIPKEDYLRVLESMKSGNKIFDKNFTTKEAGKAIKQVVNESEENVALRYSPIENQLKETINSYGHNINPAKEEAMPAIKKLNDWLEKSNESFRQKAEHNIVSDEMMQARQVLEEMGIKDIQNPALQVKQAPTVQSKNDGLSFKDVHLAKRALQESAGDYDKYKGSSSDLIKKLASTLNNNLREVSPKYAKANARYQDVEAEESFNANSPRYLAHFTGRNMAKIGATSAMHNPASMPIEMGFMAQMSPTLQKILLKSHGFNTKIGNKFSGQIGTEVTRAYQEALRKKIQPDGSIPAEPYQNERIK